MAAAQIMASLAARQGCRSTCLRVRAPAISDWRAFRCHARRSAFKIVGAALAGSLPAATRSSVPDRPPKGYRSSRALLPQRRRAGTAAECGNAAERAAEESGSLVRARKRGSKQGRQKTRLIVP